MNLQIPCEVQVRYVESCLSSDDRKESVKILSFSDLPVDKRYDIALVDSDFSRTFMGTVIMRGCFQKRVMPFVKKFLVINPDYDVYLSRFDPTVGGTS